MKESVRGELKKVKRVVVKVGTSTLTHATGRLNLDQIEKLVRQISDLANEGREMILVTSGAVGAGIAEIGLSERPSTIPEKQACAAVGQGILMHIYRKFFSEYGYMVGQVLLTREDSVKRDRYANSRRTLLTLLEMSVIPIINENDAVVIDELKIGDNDTLAAMVATLVDADLLIILSDIDGMYDKNPQIHLDAKLLPVIPMITTEVEAAAGGAGSSGGTGGMATKISAGKMVTSSGIPMVIAQGSSEKILGRILSGEEKDTGTLFTARSSRIEMRKRFLAFGARTKGVVVVDSGCEKALLEKGSSLLPTGVISVEGDFHPGDTVKVLNEAGQEIARGLVNYSYDEALKIKGASTNKLAEILGHKSYDELIHRDYLVVLTGFGKNLEEEDKV